MTRCHAAHSAVGRTGRGGHGRDPLLISTILVSTGFLGGTNVKRLRVPVEYGSCQQPVVTLTDRVWTRSTQHPNLPNANICGVQLKFQNQNRSSIGRGCIWQIRVLVSFLSTPYGGGGDNATILKMAIHKNFLFNDLPHA